MKIEPKVLESEQLSRHEMDAFLEIIAYAKSCQESGDREAMKGFVENKVNEVVKDEVL